MPSPLSHTRLEDLVVKFLKSIDSYNSTDLAISDTDTDQDSLGERARICINLALHNIYALIKDSKYLESFPSTKLYSSGGVDFIDLDEEAFLDDIEAITDTTNDYKLIRKSWNWYRRNFPDPSQTSGVPVYYIRRNSRIYLAPRPSSRINYTIDFRKFMGDLKLASDLPLLPTTYDGWIISEARVEWCLMEDRENVPPLVVAERDSKRQTSLESVLTGYDTILQSGSNTERSNLGVTPYSRPVGGSA